MRERIVAFVCAEAGACAAYQPVAYGYTEL